MHTYIHYWLKCLTIWNTDPLIYVHIYIHKVICVHVYIHTVLYVHGHTHTRPHTYSHGRGTYAYDNGDKYEGTYANGFRQTEPVSIRMYAYMYICMYVYIKALMRTALDRQSQ